MNEQMPSAAEVKAYLQGHGFADSDNVMFALVGVMQRLEQRLAVLESKPAVTAPLTIADVVG